MLWAAINDIPIQAIVVGLGIVVWALNQVLNKEGRPPGAPEANGPLGPRPLARPQGAPAGQPTLRWPTPPGQAQSGQRPATAPALPVNRASRPPARRAPDEVMVLRDDDFLPASGQSRRAASPTPAKSPRRGRPAAQSTAPTATARSPRANERPSGIAPAGTGMTPLASPRIVDDLPPTADATALLAAIHNPGRLREAFLLAQILGPPRCAHVPGPPHRGF